MIPDAAVAPCWLTATALLGLAAWRWGRRLHPDDLLPAALMHALVLAWAAVVLAALVLGAVGALTGWALLLTVAAGAGLALLWDRRLPPAAAASAWPAERAEAVRLALWGVLLAFCPVRYGLCFLSLAVCTLALVLHEACHARERLVTAVGYIELQ
jgi:hypothetical protein